MSVTRARRPVRRQAARIAAGRGARGRRVSRATAVVGVLTAGAALVAAAGGFAVGSGWPGRPADASGGTVGAVAQTLSPSPLLVAASPVAAGAKASPGKPAARTSAVVGAVRPAVPPVRAVPRNLSLRKTVVAIAFPLRPGVRYRYTNDFLARRAGVVRPYNHVWGRNRDRTLHRAHDGVDIYVRLGVPVLAPFDGVVVDAATRWKPWDRSRAGLTVAIVSEERPSRGYAALLMHLSRVAVRPGQRVSRGQVVGATGDTGNARGLPVHLHFELRAPFRFPVREAGRRRLMDAVDPYPSLAAADPRRWPARPARSHGTSGPWQAL